MAKLTYFSIGVLALALAVVLALGSLGLAVREGAANEVLFWFPARGKYQLIVRVGPDSLPWHGRGGPGTAINVWAHGRGTDWHVFKMLGVALGERADVGRAP